MTPTVDELRNEIREAVGRYERIESTAFTKEALVAICEAVDADVDTDNRPSKQTMRASILFAIGERDAENSESVARPFRKAELVAIESALESA